MVSPLRKVTDKLMLRVGKPDIARQSGAIPYTVVQGQVVYLLITSRGTGRWIFPKGAPMKGLAAWDVAAQEAIEEAGVEGDIDHRPIGSYRTFKTQGFRRKIIDVEMYPLRVTMQHFEWAEKSGRHRHWAILPEVKRLLRDSALIDLAVKLNRRLRSEPLPVYPPIDHIAQ